MSLRIRLARGGAKKRPYYRIVVADARAPRDGRFIEKIGSYNPMLAKDDAKRIVLDAERAKHWLTAGARPSDRVARFLAGADLMAPRPIPQQTKKSQPKKKAQERMKAEAEAKAAETPPAADAPSEPAPAAEAVAAAQETAPDEPPVDEAPVEEAPVDEAPVDEAPADEPATEAAAEAAEDKPASE